MESYYGGLTVVNGIKFTKRQVDVLSCMINARVKHKQISHILGIAPTVVSSYVTSIREKISQSHYRDNDIIAYIEKAKNYKELKRHYQHLLLNYNFAELLKSIAKKINIKNDIISIYYSTNSTHYFLLGNHKKKGVVGHLDTLGFKVEKHMIDLQLLAQSTQDQAPILIVSQNIVQVIYFDSCNLAIQNNDILKIIKPQSEGNSSPKILTVNCKNDLHSLVIELITNIASQYKSNFCRIVRDAVKQHQDVQTKPLSYFYQSKDISLFELRCQSTLPSNLNFLRRPKLLFLIMTLLLLSTFFLYLNTKDNIVFREEEVWNLPLKLEHYVHRSQFIEQIWEKLLGSPKTNQSISLVGLYGLGGAGKTTIANHIMHHPRKRYNLRVWFDAEKDRVLQEAYIDLGARHRILQDNWSVSQKITTVKNWMAKQHNILLVYDNVPNVESIKKYIPSRGDILITSRNYKLPCAIAIDVMTEAEATKFLSLLLHTKSLNHQIYEINDIKHLAKKLGHLPLALSQAGAYIYANHLSIKEYLKMYRAIQDQLLLDTARPSLDNQLPTYITWDLSINKLKNIEGGEEAIKLLNFMSYFHPDNIPKALLAKFLFKRHHTPTAQMALNKNLDLLSQYSLVKISHNTISMHRLIYSWVKRKHSHTTKISHLNQCIFLLKSFFPKNEDFSEDIIFLKSLLPHIETLISQSKSLKANQQYAELLYIVGVIKYFLGDYQESCRQLKQSLLIQEQILGANHLNISYILGYLAMSHYELAFYKKSIKLLERSLSIQEKNGKKNLMDIAYTLRRLGMVKCELGNYGESIEVLKKSLKIKNEFLGADSLDSAYIRRNLGVAYRKLGDYHKSIELLEKVIAIEKQHLGEDHLYISYPIHQLAKTYRDLGMPHKSLKLFIKSLKIKEKYLPEDNIEIAYTLHQIGVTYAALGRYVKSLNILQQALNIKRKYLDQGNIEIADSRQQIATTLALVGYYHQSLEMFKEALLIKENYLGKENLYTASTLYQMGLVYQKLGNKKHSTDCFKRALRIRYKYLGPQHIKSLRTAELLSDHTKLQ